MDERHFTSLTDTQGTTTTALSTVSDSMYPTYHDLGDADRLIVAAAVMTNDIAEPQSSSPPGAAS